MFRKYLLVSLFLILFCSTKVFALTPTEEFYVNDYVGILTPQQKNEMIKASEFLYDQNGVQVVTVIVPNYIGNSIEDYALQVFNDFGIGSKGDDNGVLLLVAVDDGKVQITTGDGFSGYLSASEAGKLLDDYFIPKASKGDIATATYDTHMQLINVGSKMTTAAGSSNAQQSSFGATMDDLANGANPSTSNSGDILWFILFFFLIFGGGFFGHSRNRRRRGLPIIPTLFVMNRRQDRRQDRRQNNNGAGGNFGSGENRRNSGGGGRSRGGGAGRDF